MCRAMISPLSARHRLNSPRIEFNSPCPAMEMALGPNRKPCKSGGSNARRLRRCRTTFGSVQRRPALSVTDFTDSKGKRKLTLKLSTRRATAAKDYLQHFARGWGARMENLGADKRTGGWQFPYIRQSERFDRPGDELLALLWPDSGAVTRTRREKGAALGSLRSVWRQRNRARPRPLHQRAVLPPHRLHREIPSKRFLVTPSRIAP